jgi:hypothetical protein
MGQQLMEQSSATSNHNRITYGADGIVLGFAPWILLCEG